MLASNDLLPQNLMECHWVEETVDSSMAEYSVKRLRYHWALWPIEYKLQLAQLNEDRLLERG